MPLKLNFLQVGGIVLLSMVVGGVATWPVGLYHGARMQEQSLSAHYADELFQGNGLAIPYAKLPGGSYAKELIVDQNAGVEVVEQSQFGVPSNHVHMLISKVPPEILSQKWFGVDITSSRQ